MSALFLSLSCSGFFFFLITLIKVDGFFFLIYVLVLYFLNFTSQSLLSLSFVALVEFWFGLILGLGKFHNQWPLWYKFEWAFSLSFLRNPFHWFCNWHKGSRRRHSLWACHLLWWYLKERLQELYCLCKPMKFGHIVPIIKVQQYGTITAHWSIIIWISLAKLIVTHCSSQIPQKTRILTDWLDKRKESGWPNS